MESSRQGCSSLPKRRSISVKIRIGDKDVGAEHGSPSRAPPVGLILEGDKPCNRPGLEELRGEMYLHGETFPLSNGNCHATISFYLDGWLNGAPSY